MSTTNSEQFRFLQLTLGLGILSAMPFYMHPMGLQRPDGWMYHVASMLPVVVLLRFHRPLSTDAVIALERYQSWLTGRHSCLSSRVVCLIGDLQ